jgi:cytochrome c553
MLKRVVLGCVVAVGLAGAACGGDDGGGDEPAGDGGGAGCGTDTYKSYISPLFASTAANCIVCHGTTPVGNDVSLDTYPEVKEHKEHIIEHVVELKDPIMPMGTQGLPKADRDRINAWFTCGAPEG